MRLAATRRASLHVLHELLGLELLLIRMLRILEGLRGQSDQPTSACRNTRKRESESRTSRMNSPAWQKAAQRRHLLLKKQDQDPPRPGAPVGSHIRST